MTTLRRTADKVKRSGVKTMSRPQPSLLGRGGVAVRGTRLTPRISNVRRLCYRAGSVLVAQPEEQQISNLQVAGSNPAEDASPSPWQ